MPPKLSKEEERRRYEIYMRGLPHDESARLIGISRDSYAHWRSKRGLKSNLYRAKGPRGPRLSKEEDERRLKVYEDAPSERAAAIRLGIAPHSLHNWRVSRGLPKKLNRGLSPEADEFRFKIYENSKSDEEAVIRSGVSNASYHNWRRRRGLPRLDAIRGPSGFKSTYKTQMMDIRENIEAAIDALDIGHVDSAKEFLASLLKELMDE